MAYASYEFYKSTFGGTAIPKEKWYKMSCIADGSIKDYTLNQVRLPAPSEVMLAACAVADVIFAFELEKEKRNQSIKSENVDGYSVAYEDFEVMLTRRAHAINDAVNTYLPKSHPLRYRGV